MPAIFALQLADAIYKQRIIGGYVENHQRLGVGLAPNNALHVA